MPNWCSNTLEVQGDNKRVKEFAKKAEGKNTKLSLASLYPEPDYEKTEVKPTFPDVVGNNEPVSIKDSWWDWRIQNWGTKWDVKAEIVAHTNGEIVYSFDSAWSPPVDWLEKVAQDYPELEFELEYEETGMGFEGVATAIDGEVTNETYDVEYGECKACDNSENIKRMAQLGEDWYCEYCLAEITNIKQIKDD